MKSIMYIITCVVFIVTTSCSQSKVPVDNNNTTEEEHEHKLGQYIVELYEDSKGNLWIGTLSKGIARYDGKTLKYFTMEDGLIGNAVVSMVEDKDGNLWFGTQSGLSKYDGEKFTNFNDLDGLIHFRVSHLMVDSKNTLWISTWGGISTYDGKKFETFDIPEPEVDNPTYLNTMDWITELNEDSEGNIWIGRDGYGATKYDGSTFKFYTKSDGLYSNNVTNILVDDKQNLWIGTRIVERDNPDPTLRKGAGGIQLFRDGKLVDLPAFEKYKNTDNYMITQDKSGNIWFGVNGVGVIKYDGLTYKLIDKFIPTSKEIPTGFTGFFEDSKENKYIATNNGLYNIQDSVLVHVTQESILNF